MERLRSLIVPVALAVASCTGCMTAGGKPSMKLESLNRTLKEALPASATTPSAVSKTAPATQFAAAWQTKLAQLPDPTKNGVMNRGIVGQAFLYTDKLAAADIVGSLTVVVNDATDRANGAAAKQPNVWHFDAETLRRMVVNDDRFGKSVALFLPWPEEWNDVNRLYLQRAGRYYAVRSKGVALRLFADRGKEMQQYLKAHRLRFNSPNRESSVVELARYYNGLPR